MNEAERRLVQDLAERVSLLQTEMIQATESFEILRRNVLRVSQALHMLNEIVAQNCVDAEGEDDGGNVAPVRDGPKDS